MFLIKQIIASVAQTLIFFSLIGLTCNKVCKTCVISFKSIISDTSVCDDLSRLKNPILVLSDSDGL